MNAQIQQYLKELEGKKLDAEAKIKEERDTYNKSIEELTIYLK